MGLLSVIQLLSDKYHIMNAELCELSKGYFAYEGESADTGEAVSGHVIVSKGQVSVY